MIQAIETTYQGYRFRSRLEARWAVFFDALGMEWQYEKEGYNLGQEGYYLPDFWLPYESGEPGWGHWVEIKPLAPTDSECRKLAALAKLSGHRTYCCAGDPGNCEVWIWQHHHQGQPKSGDFLFPPRYSPQMACGKES